MSKNSILKQLAMIGLDYKQSPVEIREKVSFSASNVERAYEKLKQDGIIKECIIISTCNRSELYAVLNNPEEDINYLKSFYAKFFKISEKKLKDYLVLRTKENMVKHIFEVSCGFKSLVLGEDQVLGQVKESYKTAIKHKSSGKILNRLFLDSITTAKKIKTSTGISCNSLSISAIGVKLIEQKLGNLQGKSALIIGLGEMSKISIKNLLEKGTDKIYVTNRTTRKIIDFAKEFPQITQIDFKNRYNIIPQVDIIVSCTAAPHFVLHKEKFDEHYNDKPLCLLDLAVPRDIEPQIQDINENIKLYRLDDLDEIAKENIEKRLQVKEQSAFMLKHDMKKYIKWLEETKAIDLIMTVQNCSQKIINQELNELKDKLDNMPEDQILMIERSFRTLAKSLIHKQTMKIKEMMIENNDIHNDIWNSEESVT